MHSINQLVDIAKQNRHRHTAKTLVENRVLYESYDVDLSIYDTYEPAEKITLTAEEILYCGMISGKKTLNGNKQFKADFLPHESFVMAPGESIEIDFPDAKLSAPTSCLTLSISREKLRNVCDKLNHITLPAKQMDDWHYNDAQVLHTFHTEATQNLIIRMAHSFLNDDADRDLVLNLGVTELLTRMLRQQGREFLQQCAKKDPTMNGISSVINYIENKLSQNIEIDQLSKIACMSRSKLYSEFKKIIGCSPNEYIHQVRLNHAKNLIERGSSITDACYSVGYSNACHFSRRFQQHYGVSPRHFSQKKTPIASKT